jgi:Spy/CpxP family protein refolding chaperone
MKRFVRDALIAVTSIGLVFPLAALAQREGPRGGPPGAGALVRVLEKNAERLQLDEATLAQIRGIAEDSRKTIAPLAERKRSAHEAMRTLLDEPVPDEGKVMAQADVLGEIDVQLQKERLRSLIGIRRLLTADQLTKLNEIQAERREEMKKRRGVRRFRGAEGPGFDAPAQRLP